MEIETTLAGLPKHIKKLHHPPDSRVRILIEEPESARNNRWSRLAERIRSDAPLSGSGDHVLEQSEHFRKEFAFPHDRNGS